MFKILIGARAQKELENLDKKAREYVLDKIIVILGRNPFPTGKNPKKLTDCRYFRLRAGDIRILYTVQSDEVWIYAIGRRKDIYRLM